jgi:hypothetical protein
MSGFKHSLVEFLAKCGLPRLPARFLRWLLIELEELDEKHGFAGDMHKYWLTTPAVREAAAAQSAILPDESVTGHYGAFYYDELTKLPVRNQEEYNAARNAVVGFKPTIALLVGTYQKSAEAYCMLWEERRAPFEAFHAQLGPIKEFAIAICRSRWPAREDWFDNVVLPHAVAQLEHDAAAWRVRSRGLETKRLVSKKPARKRRSKRPAVKKVDLAPAAPIANKQRATAETTQYKTPLGRNIDRFRNACGWSLKGLARAAGVTEKTVTRHTSEGTKADKATIDKYARAFSSELYPKKSKRPITAEDLTTWPPKDDPLL